MSEDLMRETNELIKRLLKLRAEDTAEREKQKAEAAAEMEKWDDEREKRESEVKMPDMDNFQKDHQARMAQLEEEGREAREREDVYRQELLFELRRQNELLERIALRVSQ